MQKIMELIVTGGITIEELAAAPELIERASLVTEGLKACKKTLLFPLGETEISCYAYTDRAGEYEAWASCTSQGICTFYTNWGGNHKIGEVNLNDHLNVFQAFDDHELRSDLKRFLSRQIEKAEK